MPIDQEILDIARMVHTELLRTGRPAEAAGLRMAVAMSIAEQEEEERFGTECISECIGAVNDLRSGFISLCGNPPIKAKDISSVLRASVPEIGLMLRAESGPMWLRHSMIPINQSLRRLVSALRRAGGDDVLGPDEQARFVECVTAMGMMRAGDIQADDQ